MDKRILDQVIWNEWAKNKTADIKPSGLDFVMDTMPFKARFKHSVLDDEPFTYEAEDKSISFKPAGMWWITPGQESISASSVSPSVGSLAGGKVKYPSALGSGIDIECSTERTRWRKQVIIKSLASLGAIPANAEFLEIGFEIETDFDIEGWDKKSELRFTEAVRLSELSQLESIKTWDNHIIPEPKEGEEPEGPFLRCDGFLREENGRYYLVKRVPVGYLKQAVYPVITDTVISYGAEYEFNAAATTYISCAALDATHFVVGYRDLGGDSYGIAMIGVVTGDAIAYGAEYEFNAAATYWTSCAALDSTHFVVGYHDGGDSYHGKAKIGVVTGDAIAYGAEYEFKAATTTYISCAALDATHFVVGYRDGGDTFGKAMIGVVTGDAIAYGAEYEFNAANTDGTSCAALDATHFVVGYRDPGGDSYGIAMIGVVTGDAIAYGAEYEFKAANAGHISCAALDATHFVVGYQDGGDSYHGKAKIGVVSSGDEIAYGAEYEFNAASTSYISCAALDSTHFVVGYRDGGDTFGKAMIGVVTGDAIAYGAEYEFNAATTDCTSCAATECATGISLGSTIFVVGYRDLGGDSYGIAMIGTTSEAPVGLENKSANMAAKMIAGKLI